MVQSKVENSASQLANAVNVKNKWSFLYNVKELGSCKGNGTDETSGIQKTIDTAIANGAKTVMFPPGNYVASSLTGLDQVVLFGDNATLTVGGSAVPITQLGAAPLSDLSTIINGNFDVWQRGASFSGSSIFTADRWIMGNGGGICSVTRQSVGLGDSLTTGPYCLQFQQTSVGGSSPQLFQKIEDVRTFAGQQVTLCFRAKSLSGSHAVGVRFRQQFGSGGSPSANVDVNPAPITVNTTEKTYFVTATLPSIAGKVLGTNGDDALHIQINFPASVFAIKIAQVQLYLGDARLPFQPRSYAEELALCLWYFRRRTYDLAGLPVGMVSADSATVATSFLQFPKMRTRPTITLVATDFEIRMAAVTKAITSINPAVIGDVSARLDIISSGMTAGQIGVLRRPSGSPSNIDFDAEL